MRLSLDTVDTPPSDRRMNQKNAKGSGRFSFQRMQCSATPSLVLRPSTSNVRPKQYRKSR